MIQEVLKRFEEDFEDPDFYNRWNEGRIPSPNEIKQFIKREIEKAIEECVPKVSSPYIGQYAHGYVDAIDQMQENKHKYLNKQ